MQAAVSQTLSEPGYETLAEAATWPDTFARNRPEYAPMKPFHYVNVDVRARSYQRERDCPHGCVVTALEQFVALLESDDQEPLGVSERRRCIYWIAHLMGDIHQPLHVAHPDGKGGNATRLRFFELPEERNAHWVWDVGLLARRPPPPPALASRVASDQPAFRALADELYAGLTPEQVRAYGRTTSAEALANESFALARQVSEATTGHVDARYQAQHWPLVTVQLQKAGVRLAAVLSRALSPKAPRATR